MWVPISQEKALALRDHFYDRIQPDVLREEFDTAPDGTKFFKYRIMEWHFMIGLPLLRVETKNNINHWYEWEDDI
jgi:hypothetical protein